jgi:hypothetical protein
VQPEQETFTATEAQDSYEIYSMLLRTQMPARWNITVWAIKQETQAFPKPRRTKRGDRLPLIDDYTAQEHAGAPLERPLRYHNMR